MAKQPRYKRTLGKDGKPYYFELKKDASGVTRYLPIQEEKGRQKFIEQNYSNLTKPSQREKQKLSEKEQKTYDRAKNQKDLWRIKGKAIKRWKSDLMEFAKLIDPKSKTRDLDKLPTPYVRPSEVDKDVNEILKSLPLIPVETEIGADGFRERTEATGIHDIVERLDFVGTDGWKIAVTTEDGDVLRGERALTYLKDWEIAMTEEISETEDNVAMVRFKYMVQYDGESRTIYIDANDIDWDIATSDPIKRTK
jgi:hypothetical protein